MKRATTARTADGRFAKSKAKTTAPISSARSTAALTRQNGNLAAKPAKTEPVKVSSFNIGNSSLWPVAVIGVALVVAWFAGKMVGSDKEKLEQIEHAVATQQKQAQAWQHATSYAVAEIEKLKKRGTAAVRDAVKENPELETTGLSKGLASGTNKLTRK